MNKSWFTLQRVNKSNGHEDFYFAVTHQILLQDLIQKYSEMCLKYISFIYSKDEDILYMTKGFIFNEYTIVCNTEPEIKQILKKVASDYKEV